MGLIIKVEITLFLYGFLIGVAFGRGMKVCWWIRGIGGGIAMAFFYIVIPFSLAAGDVEYPLKPKKI